MLVACVIALLPMMLPGNGAPDLVQALRALESARAEGSPGVEDALLVLGRMLGPDDRPNWQRAVEITRNQEVPVSVRAFLLGLLLEKARPSERMEFVTVAQTWVLRLRADRGSEQPLIYRFVEELRKPAFWEGVRSEDEVITLLGGIIHFDTPMLDPRIRAQAWRLLATSSAPRDLVRGAVLEAIRSAPKIERLWPEMAALLDAKMIPDLRSVVRETQPLHGMATAALAHLGDVDIRPLLPERRRNPAERQLAGRSIWQIDAQTDNQTLLAKITVIEEADGANGQRWALQRATELGIDKGAIRGAVLSFAATAKPVVIHGKETSSADLIDLKHLARELGILEADDLPDVPESIKVTP